MLARVLMSLIVIVLALMSVFIAATSEPLTQGKQDWARQEWSYLSELVGRAHETTGVPALAVVVMRDGEITDEAIAGVRAMGVEGDATLDDRFHIGSITKSMTATVIARLIELGELDWDTTIAEALPDMEVREEEHVAVPWKPIIELIVGRERNAALEANPLDVDDRPRQT